MGCHFWDLVSDNFWLRFQLRSGQGESGVNEAYLIALTGGMLTRLYKKAAATNGGHAPPEARLVMGMAGAIGESLVEVLPEWIVTCGILPTVPACPAGMWIFAFTTYRHVHWIWPIIGSIPFGMGTVWTFNSVFTYLVE